MQDIAFTDGDGGSCSVERIEHAEAEGVCASLYTQFIAERSVYIEWDARFQKLGGWGTGSRAWPSALPPPLCSIPRADCGRTLLRRRTNGCLL